MLYDHVFIYVAILHIQLSHCFTCRTAERIEVHIVSVSRVDESGASTMPLQSDGRPAVVMKHLPSSGQQLFIQNWVHSHELIISYLYRCIRLWSAPLSADCGSFRPSEPSRDVSEVSWVLGPKVPRPY